MMKSLSTINKILILGFSLRFVLFLYVLSFPPASYDGDTDQFLALAENLIERGKFEADVNGVFPTGSVRVPGYPVFLAASRVLTGSKTSAALFLQIVLGTLNIFLAYTLALRLGMSERIAHLAALLLAIDPTSIIYCNTLMSELLFTTFVVLYFLALYDTTERASGRNALIIISLLTACLVYIRPIALFLPAATVLIVMLISKQKKPQKLFFGLAHVTIVILLVAPWLMRNQHKYGFTGLTSIAASDLLYYDGALAMARDEGITWDEAQDILQDRLHRRVNPDAVSLEKYLSEMQKLGVETIFAHLPTYTRLHTQGMFLTMLDPGRVNFSRVIYGPRSAPGLLNALGAHGIAAGIALILKQEPTVFSLFMLGLFWQMVIFLSASIGVVHLWRHGKEKQLLILLAVIFYFVFLPGPFGAARFRVPITPLWLTISAAGLTTVWHMMQTKRHGSSVLLIRA